MNSFNAADLSLEIACDVRQNHVLELPKEYPDIDCLRPSGTDGDPFMIRKHKKFVMFDEKYFKLLCAGYIRSNFQRLVNVDINPSDISRIVMKFIGCRCDSVGVRFGAPKSKNHARSIVIFKSLNLIKDKNMIPKSGISQLKIKMDAFDCRRKRSAFSLNGYSIQCGIIGLNKSAIEKQDLDFVESIKGSHLWDKNLESLGEFYSEYDPKTYGLYFGCTTVNNNKRYICSVNIDQNRQILHDSDKYKSSNTLSKKQKSVQYDRYDVVHGPGRSTTTAAQEQIFDPLNRFGKKTVNTDSEMKSQKNEQLRLLEEKMFRLNEKDVLSLRVDFTSNCLYFMKNCQIVPIFKDKDDHGVVLDLQNYDYYYALTSESCGCADEDVQGFQYSISYQYHNC